MPDSEATSVSGLAPVALERETDWAIPENVPDCMVRYMPDAPMPQLQFTEIIWPIGRLGDILGKDRFDVPARSDCCGQDLGGTL